jgi:hypothetical protein
MFSPPGAPRLLNERNQNSSKNEHFLKCDRSDITCFVEFNVHALQMRIVFLCTKVKKKSKAIPVTGRGGLLGCEMLRIPHCLDNRLTVNCEILAT